MSLVARKKLPHQMSEDWPFFSARAVVARSGRRRAASLPQLGQCLAHHFCGALDVVGAVCGRDESRLELRGREIDALLQTGVEELCESLQIASLCAGEVLYRPRGK